MRLYHSNAVTLDGGNGESRFQWKGQILTPTKSKPLQSHHNCKKIAQKLISFPR